MYNNHNKKYDLDENYFKHYTNNMAYILGYIIADGNVDKTKYRLRIDSIDIQILQDINKEFKSNRPIKKEKKSNGEWNVLVIDNINIYNDLIKLGIYPNKTYQDIYIDIPDEYKIDFFRGFFDGDGCVYSKNHNDSIPTISIDIATMSNSLIEYLTECIKDLFDDNHKFSIQKRKNGLNILRLNSTISERLYNKMYYDNCICLKRKKEKFESIIKIRNSNRKIKKSKAHII